MAGVIFRWKMSKDAVLEWFINQIIHRYIYMDTDVSIDPDKCFKMNFEVEGTFKDLSFK